MRQRRSALHAVMPFTQRREHLIPLLTQRYGRKRLLLEQCCVPRGKGAICRGTLGDPSHHQQRLLRERAKSTIHHSDRFKGDRGRH